MIEFVFFEFILFNFSLFVLQDYFHVQLRQNLRKKLQIEFLGPFTTDYLDMKDLKLLLKFNFMLFKKRQISRVSLIKLV